MTDGRVFDFRILGPLEVYVDGEAVALSAPTLRVLLTRLLLQPGADVRVSALAETLWPTHPPSGYENAVQVHVSRLRRVVGSDRIAFGGGAYKIEVQPGELDVARFDQRAHAGFAAASAGDLANAAARFDEALRLIRGRLAAEVIGRPGTAGLVTALNERWLHVCEEAFDLRLRRGEHHGTVADLQGYAADHPLRERGRRQLMLALHRSGRSAEAVRAFQEYRTMLVDEVGVEPSPELVKLEEAILRHDPAIG